MAVRRLSDLICVQHRMSVIENPKPHGMSYNRWQGNMPVIGSPDIPRSIMKHMRMRSSCARLHNVHLMNCFPLILRGKRRTVTRRSCHL